MKKENLLLKKRELVSYARGKNSNLAFLDCVISDDDLRAFSLPQLVKVFDIVLRCQKYQDDCSPFLHFDCNNIYVKKDNVVIVYDSDSLTAEVKEIECLKEGACEPFYRLLTKAK